MQMFQETCSFCNTVCSVSVSVVVVTVRLKCVMVESVESVEWGGSWSHCSQNLNREISDETVGPRSVGRVTIWFHVSADDRDSVSVEDHAGGGFVGAGQVVQVLAVGVATRLGHLLVLVHAHHQALVTHRLHVVLIAVRRLVQGALRGDTGFESIVCITLKWTIYCTLWFTGTKLAKCMNEMILSS